MIVFCRACQKHYDDSVAWSLCPHAPRPVKLSLPDADTVAERLAEWDFLTGATR